MQDLTSFLNTINDWDCLIYCTKNSEALYKDIMASGCYNDNAHDEAKTIGA